MKGRTRLGAGIVLATLGAVFVVVSSFAGAANPRSNAPVTVAASNDYVDEGLTVMRTKDGGHSWQTVRFVPVYHHPGDPLSNNTCNGGDPSVAYSARDHVFFASQLCFFRGLPQSEVQIYLSR